ncbi:M20 family metallopeptidase [Ignisphaera sp. 4213-co]|uniref:Probable succinyl-diaminopimelate desuccinylase n=1 Tax=Ignisphaera cupida TaxID=3050454 RepID=A0ABD4Z416_9CREN|nr:M20 family metallopeptidase [Ignisphaera sp. 4213-co]MDK6027890.1 M20 family metallopeptidase [Ignisphaera sp. 4213-co]
MGVLEYVSRNLDWGLKILGDMISIPTVNPPGEKYKEFVYYARDVLTGLGMDVEIVEVPKDYVARYYPEYSLHSRYILIGRLGRGKPVVHFNGHYDVVPAGSGWSSNPFDAVVRNGKVYGRGASDMKGGIASFILALKSFVETTKSFSGSVEVALVPDEEIGGETGTGFLVRELGSKPDYVVIGEPSSSEIIWIGHKGALWTLVEVYGRQAHGSTPWLGINAFEYMAKIAMRIISEYKPVLDSRKSVYEYEDERGAKPTITIGGEVRGGAKTNVVPGYYAFSVDRRVTPDEDLESVEKEFMEFINRVAADYPEVKISVRVLHKSPPALTNPNSELVTYAKSVAKEVIGKEPKTTVCLGGLDMRYYTEKNIQTIAYGPGTAGTAHIADEFLPISEFEKMSKIYLLLLNKILLKT